MTLYLVETQDPRIVSYLARKHMVIRIIVIVKTENHRPLNALSKKDKSVRVTRLQPILLTSYPL